MKHTWLILCLLLILFTCPVQVSAMTWEEFVEEYGEMPPPPPDATNTDVWPFDTPTFEPMGDYSDGGRSIKDMDNDVYLAGISWEGQETWLWT